MKIPTTIVHGSVFKNDNSPVVAQDAIVDLTVEEAVLVHHQSFISYGPVTRYFHDVRIPHSLTENE
jgi:hypothetical protein